MDTQGDLCVFCIWRAVMILGKLIDAMIDEILELIKNGYTKMDQYNDFSDVYDDIMKEYQEKYDSDAFYKIFFEEDYTGKSEIKRQLDQDILTRELPSEIIVYITERLGEAQTTNLLDRIHEFVAKLISRLLYVDSYRKKIMKYRQDADISDIKDTICPNILNICKKSCEEFSKIFTKKLFLEMDDPNGKTLQDVYVESPCIRQTDRDDILPGHIHHHISEFLCNSTYLGHKIMLIVGNAGIGKSTLLASLANSYVKQNVLYDYKKVFCLELKNLHSNSNAPLKDVCDNLKLNDLSALENSLILLDAYDELACTNTPVNRFFDMLIDQLSDYNCKIIMTVRKNYIELFNIRHDATIIHLLPFDHSYRKKWLDKYGKEIKCYDYLISPLDEETSLFGTPLVLYLIASGDLDIQAAENNKFKLYNILFGLEALKKRQYAKRHLTLYDNADKLYELMLEIALYLFQRNANLLIDRQTISNVLLNRLNTENDELDGSTKQILTKYCGIVSYFNDKGDGVLEYVHKSIYEFYLSIKIYKSIKTIFKAFSQNEDNIHEYIDKISDLLLYAKLTDQTFEFIYEQIKIDASELSKIATDITDFLYKFLLLGPKTIRQSTPNFLTQIKNIFLNIWRIYNRLILLTDKDLLASWFKDKDKKQILFEFINLSQYDGLELEGIHLIDVDLENSVLINAVLNTSDLDHVYLNEAYLKGAYLDNAHLNDTYLNNAYLSYAHLNNASLINTSLVGAHLNYAVLSGSHLNGVDLSYAHLNRADLNGAHLNDTNLEGADLRGANLEGADLNTTIFSINQKTKITLEQLNYLLEKGLNFDYFEVYKDTLHINLATPEDIANVMKKIDSKTANQNLTENHL